MFRGFIILVFFLKKFIRKTRLVRFVEFHSTVRTDEVHSSWHTSSSQFCQWSALSVLSSSLPLAFHFLYARCVVLLGVLTLPSSTLLVCRVASRMLQPLVCQLPLFPRWWCVSTLFSQALFASSGRRRLLVSSLSARLLSTERRVVVTGIGMVSPLGPNTKVTWDRLLSGSCGVGKISSFPSQAFPCQIAAEVPSEEFNVFEHVKQGVRCLCVRCVHAQSQ